MENACYEEYACLSFNSYSSDKLREIAVKVAAETNNGDDDFEFSLVSEDKEFSAEEFAYDGQIGSFFPVFNRDLLRRNDGDDRPLGTKINVPLGKLLFGDDDGDNPGSCSSSEAEELENIPAGTYCVWRPKAADQPSPSRCKKSRSTGSTSKRWKFSDLLRRSNSEGKDSFVFLTPKNREEKVAVEVPKKGKGKGVDGAGSKPLARSAHEALYVRNRTIREGDKKKSYLPYRQDLLGFFVNSNVFTRT